MKTALRVTNPDDIVMELTVSMSLKHWKELQQQLPAGWPAWELSRTINDMVGQANKQFYPIPTAAQDLKTILDIP